MTKQQRVVLIVSIMASFVGAIDGFIVNVALPTISRELGGGLVTQQWTVDAYLISLGALILIAGSLSDLFGRRKVLLFGLLWFGIASLLCAAAPNGPFLIIARALQGVGGALLVPSSLAMIISSFKGAAQGKAIGTWTAWFSVAAVAGPLLGGLILTFRSWRWIFAINVLPIAVTLWLLRKLEHGEPTNGNTKIDTPGAILCAAGLAGAVYGLIEQPHHGWSSSVIWVPLVGGLLSLVAFVWWEGRNKQPMLPLSLFTVRNFSAGNVATAAIYGGLSMATFILVIFLQQVAGYSPLRAGLALLPVTVIMFTISSRFGALAGRYGPRLFMTFGPILAGVGFLLMTRVDPHVHYLTQLLPGVLVFGVGLATTVAPLTSAVLADIKSEHAGVASAVNNAISRIAGLVTIAVVGVIIGTHLDVDGFRRILVLTTILMFVGGAISFAGIRNPKHAAAKR